PEQVVGKHLSARSDIFSLGVVLYEALTGVAPFESDTISSIMYQTVHVAQQPPSSLNPELGPELDAIIAKALAKSPEDRIDTMKAFSRGLRDIRRGRTGTAGLATSANFQLTPTRVASSTIPPQDAAVAPAASTTAPPAVATAPPVVAPKPSPAVITPSPVRDDLTRATPRPSAAAVNPPAASASIPPAPDRTAWPVAVANQFDSTIATMRLAEITAQTEEIKEFISASRQMPAFQEPAPAKTPPVVEPKVDRSPGISLDKTQMTPIERKLPMGPLLLLGSLTLTVAVLAVALAFSFM
ncbi:MAG: protein kinase, partial [Betaproteobacteria bacterium]|nr:protein kinase [Betaproteobacteria bacterium]